MGQLILLAATHKLWWGSHSFPSVPVATMPRFVIAVEPLFTIALIASLLVCLCLTRPNKTWIALVTISWIALFLNNQHRIQPWAYQATLWNLAFLSLPARAARSWITAIAISVYFYSSCGKFDFQFLHTVGQDFLNAILGPASETLLTNRIILAAILPAFELAIAIGLMIPKTRKHAGVTAIAMHTMLLILLGPWAQSHSWGVIAWNALLIPQAWFLFIAPAHRPAIPIKPDLNPLAFAPLCFLLAMIMPLFERAGYWDHWLSWSLYSPHTSRVELEVHETSLERLPSDLRPLAVDSDGDHWYAVPLEAWSLTSLDVPIYPQARFELGVALRLAKQCELGDGVRAKVRSVANRWTGERTEVWLVGETSLQGAAKGFWLLPKPDD